MLLLHFIVTFLGVGSAVIREETPFKALGMYLDSVYPSKLLQNGYEDQTRWMDESLLDNEQFTTHNFFTEVRNISLF